MESVIQEAFFADDLTAKQNHYHDCHQILFVRNGIIELGLGEETRICRSGDIIILSRYGHHSIDIISDIYERYIVRLNPFVLSKLQGREFSLFLNRPTAEKNIFSVKGDTSPYERIFNSIIAETKTSDDFSGEMQQLLINQLMIMIYRIKTTLLTPSYEAEKFTMIFNVQKELENNCQEQYTLEGLAKKYHTSVSTLSHQFKKITGFSVFEYLFLCRIAYAKYMLTRTDYSIGDIVERIGFSDSSNFSRTFKSTVGMTPSQFRVKYKEA